MVSRRLPGTPVSSQQVEYRHWGAHANTDDETGLVEEYALDMQTSIPHSMKNLLKNLLDWEVLADGTCKEREHQPQFLTLPSAPLEHLSDSLQKAAIGRSSFGIIVLPAWVRDSDRRSKGQDGVGHVIVYCTDLDGTVRFIDPSQRDSDSQVFYDLLSMRSGYESAGLQLEPVF